MSAYNPFVLTFAGSIWTLIAACYEGTLTVALVALVVLCLSAAVLEMIPARAWFTRRSRR